VQQTQMGFPQAPTGPQMGQPVYQSMPPPAYAKPHHGPMILTFGILSLLCCVPLGIAAWIMGAMDLNEMNAGRMDRTGFSQTQAGLVCGAIGTVLGTLWFLASLATTP